MTVQYVAGLAVIGLAILLPFIAAGWELGDRLADWRRYRRTARIDKPGADPRKVYELEKAVGFIEGTPRGIPRGLRYPRRKGSRGP